MSEDWLTACGDDPSTSKCRTLTTVRVLFGVISLIFSLFMIFLIWLYKKYMFFTQRLLLYLSLAALVDTIPYIMGPVNNPVLCQIQAYLMTYFDWVCLLWVCIITGNMFRLIKEDIDYEQCERCFLVFCWLGPLILAFIPFFNQAYGKSGPWCWIQQEHKIMSLCIWYLPALLIVSMLTVMLIYLRIYTKQQNSNWIGYNPEQERVRSRKWKEVRLLFLYPLVYVSLAVIPLITRVHMLVAKESSFTLVLLMNISAPLLGAANSCLYSCSPQMRHQVHPKCIKDELKYRQREANSERYDFESETQRITDSYEE